MLAVEPGSTPVGPATLLSVLPPEGLDPGPDGFAVEAIGSDGTVVPLLRSAASIPIGPRSSPSGIRCGSRRGPRSGSHPGATLDLIRTPATGIDEEP